MFKSHIIKLCQDFKFHNEFSCMCFDFKSKIFSSVFAIACTLVDGLTVSSKLNYVYFLFTLEVTSIVQMIHIHILSQ